MDKILNARRIYESLTLEACPRLLYQKSKENRIQVVKCYQ